jgi:hypothetical protein
MDARHRFRCGLTGRSLTLLAAPLVPACSSRRIGASCCAAPVPARRFPQTNSEGSILPPRDLPHCRPPPRLYFRCYLQSFPPHSLQCNMNLAPTFLDCLPAAGKRSDHSVENVIDNFYIQAGAAACRRAVGWAKSPAPGGDACATPRAILPTRKTRNGSRGHGGFAAFAHPTSRDRQYCRPSGCY